MPEEKVQVYVQSCFLKKNKKLSVKFILQDLTTTRSHLFMQLLVVKTSNQGLFVSGRQVTEFQSLHKLEKKFTYPIIFYYQLFSFSFVKSIWCTLSHCMRRYTQEGITHSQTLIYSMLPFQSLHNEERRMCLNDNEHIPCK